jgi:tetratricopeptide (TPR) repeat protein
LFKLNQELKAITGEDGSLEGLEGEELNSAVHILHGTALYHVQHDNFEEARKTWQKILDIKPGDNETEENMAIATWYEGYHAALKADYEHAERLFQSLIDQGVDHGAIYQNLALVQEKQGKKDLAEETWNKALTAYKNELKQSPDNEYMKALVLAVHKYTGGKFLDGGAASYSGTGSAKEIGFAAIQKGNWKQAVEALQQAHRENPDDIDILCQLGWAYLNTNTHTKAFQMWNTALKKAPGKKSIIDHIVKGYTIFGKRLKDQRIYNQALVQFKNALKQDPNNLDLRMLLAETFYEMKNYTAALNEYNKVIEADPRNKLARQGIRESKRQGGIR